MKILYAIQATGNGHISRARQLIPYLQQRGEVVTILSGSNASLALGINPTFKSKGISLHYKKCGGLNYYKMFTQNGIRNAIHDAKNLPVEKYDLIINDFDFVTAHACKKKKVKSIQFGHQASFISDKTPRPEKISSIGELILKKYAIADQYIGLHFRKYDDHIFPPVIKKDILNANPVDKGHITTYLPSFEKSCLEHHFTSLPDIHFDWFLSEVKEKYRIGNITYNPITNNGFTNSLINSHGIITGGGFETPAEALYLQKKLMSIPIKNHYEQNCNAAAIKDLGAYTLKDIDDSKWQAQIEQWINKPTIKYVQQANKIEETLDKVFELGTT
jgi:uncharacterized protein (TIGR00661 family)